MARQTGRRSAADPKPTPKRAQYTDEQRAALTTEICEDVASGDFSMRQACISRAVKPSTFIGWMVAAPDTLGKQYEIATQIRAQVMFDRLEETARDQSLDLGDRKLLIDTQKWILGRMDPKRYSDKMALTGADGSSPVTHEVTIRFADRPSHA